MVEVTSDEQQASSQCFPLLLWLHFIWLSFFLSCCMEKTKVERDFPQHSQFSASEQPAMSPQGFAKEKLVQDAFFYFEGTKVQFFVFLTPTPIQLLCVRKTHLDCFFPSLQCPHLLDTSKGTIEGGCILYLQQCTNSYLLLHRTHYGRLDTMKNFLDYCLLHFQTLDGVYKMVFSRLIIASSKAQRGP